VVFTGFASQHRALSDGEEQEGIHSDSAIRTKVRK